MEKVFRNDTEAALLRTVGSHSEQLAVREQLVYARADMGD